TIEQLAGDLLPDATPEQVAATAFHRNTMTNVEGGTDDEEYRVAAVKDRVATTMQVWMGLTAQCAQCHSHKFDPISQREYYSLFAIFNQSEDADREDEAPRLPLPTPEQKAERARLEAEIAELKQQRASMTPEFVSELHEWEADVARPVDWIPLEADVTGSDPQEIRMSVRGPFEGLTAARLASRPQSSNQAGASTVTNFAARIVPRGRPNALEGRFVRITQKCDDAWLMLAEVEVFSGSSNIAPKGKSTASSSDFGGNPERANDGQTNGNFFAGQSVFHSNKEKNPWWEVDLGTAQPISHLVLWPRTDAHLGMLKNLRVELLNGGRDVVWETDIDDPITNRREIGVTGGRTIVLTNPSADLSSPHAGPELAIDGDAEKSGWSFADESGGTHFAIFQPESSINVPADANLVFSIRETPIGNAVTRGYEVSVTRQPGRVRALPADIREILALEPSERTADQQQRLAGYFRPLARTTAEITTRIGKVEKDLRAIKSVELPIMRELAGKDHRQTFVLNKGSYLSPGEEVEPGLPATFLAQPDGHIDRLALARWLVSRENPLTARVAVNRFWSRLFGTGLVESEEDFGTQGTLPSHPELLDWLAVDFIEGGWSVKRLLKQIVMSQTYRQTSRVTPVKLEQDPRNRLLSHFPRRRLDAEAVRDQALMVSGLLSPAIGGPSVYPPQPAGLWQVAFNGGQNAYPTSRGPDRYRRGIYTFWRRTRPNPTQSTFDAPSRETCTLRRIPTNTPLQAFVTLNDPVFVECAQALARRIISEGGSDAVSRLRFALNLCLCRPPTDEEVQTLRGLLEESLATYRQDPAAALKLATDPLGPVSEKIDIAEAAAWTVVANVLLNLDSVLTEG
ncbi:MAG: DUF1553 domain-containing protein, partial [Chthoniobacteraceae bacterium]